MSAHLKFVGKHVLWAKRSDNWNYFHNFINESNKTDKIRCISISRLWCLIFYDLLFNSSFNVTHNFVFNLNRIIIITWHRIHDSVKFFLYFFHWIFFSFNPQIRISIWFWIKYTETSFICCRFMSTLSKHYFYLSTISNCRFWLLISSNVLFISFTASRSGSLESCGAAFMIWNARFKNMRFFKFPYH